MIHFTDERTNIYCICEILTLQDLYYGEKMSLSLQRG